MNAKIFLDNYDISLPPPYPFPLLPSLPDIPNNKIKSINNTDKLYKQTNYALNSIKAYESHLKQLPNYDIDINNLIDIDIVMGRLSKKIEQSSVISYLSAILWYSKAHNINKDKYEEISKKICEHNKIEKEKLLNNELSEKTLDKYVNWKTIMEVHKLLKLLYENNTQNKKLHMYYTILSLYVLMPPRRVLDYIELYNDPNQEIIQDQIIKYSETNSLQIINKNIEFENKNYYVDNGTRGYFIFHLYKTRKTYGIQYLELNNELNLILRNYIHKNNIHIGEKILKLNHETFSYCLERIFMSYISKQLTVNDLRHIYI